MPKPDRRGPNNPNWKGGTWINSAGYIMVWAPGHPACNCRNYAPLHIKNYYDFHGELPGDGYDIHHHDLDKMNNEPSNLEPLTDAEHGRKGRHLHGTQRIRLCNGSDRARELGRKGGKAAARKRRQEQRAAERRKPRTPAKRPGRR